MRLPRLRFWKLGERTNGGQAGQSTVGQAGSLEGAVWPSSKFLSHLHFQNKCIDVLPNVQPASVRKQSNGIYCV